MGVVLYKIVFHLEKQQEKAERGHHHGHHHHPRHNRQNDSKEEEISGLITRNRSDPYLDEEEDHRIDDGDGADVIYPSRGVELLDRNDRSHSIRSKLSATTEATFRASRSTSSSGSSDDESDFEGGLHP